MMRTAKLRNIIILLSCLFLLGHADEVYLKDGRIINGEIIDNPKEGPLRFRAKTGSMSMKMIIKRHQILKIVEGPNIAEVERDRIIKERELAGPTIEAHELWRYAIQLKKLKEGRLYREYLDEIIAIDNDFEPARRALGHIYKDGQWMSERDWQISQGNVRFEGAWRSQTEVDTILREREIAAQVRKEAQYEKMQQMMAMVALQNYVKKRDIERAPQTSIHFGYYRPIIGWDLLRNGGVIINGPGYPNYGPYRYGHSNNWGSNWSLNLGGKNWSFNLGGKSNSQSGSGTVLVK